MDSPASIFRIGGTGHGASDSVFVTCGQKGAGLCYSEREIARCLPNQVFDAWRIEASKNTTKSLAPPCSDGLCGAS